MQLDIPLHLNFYVTLLGFHVSTFAAGKTVCIESSSVSKKLHIGGRVERGQYLCTVVRLELLVCSLRNVDNFLW